MGLEMCGTLWNFGSKYGGLDGTNSTGSDLSTPQFGDSENGFPATGAVKLRGTGAWKVAWETAAEIGYLGEELEPPWEKGEAG